MGACGRLVRSDAMYGSDGTRSEGEKVRWYNLSRHMLAIYAAVGT